MPSFFDNYSLDRYGLDAPPQRRVTQTPSPPQLPQLPRMEQPREDLEGQLAAVAKQFDKKEKNESLAAKIDALLKGRPELGTPPFNPDEPNPRVATRSVMSPMDGPDDGSVNPNAPDRSAYIAAMTPHVMQVSKETGLDPRLVMAQMALETGWRVGPGNNMFGIKSHGQAGGTELATTEADASGRLVPARASFRNYANPADSAADYVKFLRENSRYAPVLAAPDLQSQIDAMGRSGYATDPNYGAKLRSIAASLPAFRRGGRTPR